MARILGKRAFTSLTMSSVEAWPLRSDGQQRAARSVGAHDVGLHREAVAHLRHVLHVDRGAVHGLDRQIVQLVERARDCC